MRSSRMSRKFRRRWSDIATRSLFWKIAKFRSKTHTGLNTKEMKLQASKQL